MQHVTFDALVRFMPVVVAPVILISGVGLLLLTLTNRMGRATDRARSLHRESKAATEEDRTKIAQQVAILYRRARLLRASILLAAFSVFFAGLLVSTLFVELHCQIAAAMPVSILFVGSVLSLLASLVAFIREILTASEALRIELGQSHRDTRP